LLVNGGASNTAALLELPGRIRPVKTFAHVVAALAGPPLATYTGVLLSDTASAGAAACAFLEPADAVPARRLAVGAVAIEAALMQTMERRLGDVGSVY